MNALLGESCVVDDPGFYSADLFDRREDKERFDTVLGTIGFDEKGDAVVGPFDWVWRRWRDGTTFEVLTEPLLRGEIVEKK